MRELTYIPSGVSIAEAENIKSYVWTVYLSFKSENPVDLSKFPHISEKNLRNDDKESININQGEYYKQDFNTIGNSDTATLPEGWRIEKSDTVRSLTMFYKCSKNTMYGADGGTVVAANAKNGTYNFSASSDVSDRAIGGITTSSTSVADANKTTDILLRLKNSGSKTISNFKIAFDVEKYRLGKNPAGFSVQLYYSTDDVNWISAGDRFNIKIQPDNSTEGATETPISTYSVKSVLEQPVEGGKELYLQWSISATSGSNVSQSMALAIDNVEITADVSSDADYITPIILSMKDSEVKLGGTISVLVQAVNIYGNIVNTPLNGLTLTAEPDDGIHIEKTGNNTFDVTAKSPGVMTIKSHTDDGLSGSATLKVIDTDILVLTDGQHGVFFEKPDNWEQVKVWCWNSSLGTNYTSGLWPGVDALCIEGNFYKWISNAEIPTGSEIIFSNGGNVVGETQTANLPFYDGGFYNINGYQTTYKNTSTGITTIVNENSNNTFSAAIFDLNGKKVDVKSAKHGIYITHGKKFVIK